MVTTINRLPDSQAEISGEIAAERFAAFRQRALKQLNSETRLDGFRAGHIPENILVSRLGEEKILRQMAEFALQETYPELLREHQLDAIGRPEITLTKLAAGNPLGFKIKTAVSPEFELGQYQTIAAKVNAEPPEKAGGRDQKRWKIIEAIISQTTITLPAILVETELNNMLGEMKWQIGQAGLEFEDYLKHLKREEKDLRDVWRGEAEKRLKTGLILTKIAKKEKLEASVEAVWRFLENQV